MPEIPYLTNEHQEKLTAGLYEMLNVLECIELVYADSPTRAGSWVRAW